LLLLLLLCLCFGDFTYEAWSGGTINQCGIDLVHPTVLLTRHITGQFSDCPTNCIQFKFDGSARKRCVAICGTLQWRFIPLLVRLNQSCHNLSVIILIIYGLHCTPTQVTTFFWLLICYTQIVLNRVIVARFMADRAASFVDLVSAANLRYFKIQPCVVSCVVE
jgi:hypothetical protein